MTAAEQVVSWVCLAMGCVCVAAGAVVAVRRRALNRYWSGRIA